MESDKAEQVTIEQENPEQKAGEQKNAEQKSAQIWAQTVRGLYVLLFWFILRISEFVVAGVAIVTFGFKIATNKAQPKVLAFGDSLSTYIYQVVSFMTYKSETKPFPFQEWPKPEIIPDSVEQEESVAEVAEVVAEVVEVVEVVAEEAEPPRSKSKKKDTEDIQPPPGKEPDQSQPTA